MLSPLIVPPARPTRLVPPGECWEAMSRRRSSRGGRRNGGASGASVSVIPTTGLVLWTRSSQGVTGSPASQWNDLSGNGNHLVAAGAQRPAVTAVNAAFGGFPTLEWDGATTSMHTTGTITLGPSTYVMVLKCAAAGGYFAVFKDDSSDYWFTNNGFSSFILRGATSCTLNLGAAWGANASPRTLVRSFDGTSSNQHIRANGADLGGSVTGTDPGAGTTAQTLYIGSNQTPGGFAALSVAEIIVYARAVSGAELAGIESYLRARYGHY